MALAVSRPLRCGALTLYLSSVDGCAELQSLLLQARRSPTLWLDSARTHPVTGRWSFLATDPWLTLTACGERIECRTAAATHCWRESPLEALRALLRRYAMPPQPAVQGRMAGFFGYLSYEINRWIERLPEPQPGSDVPEMVWYGMKRVWLVDHVEKRTWLMSLADPHAPAAMARAQAASALEQMEAATRAAKEAGQALGAAATAPEALQATTTRREFERSVEKIQEFIRAGDVFQANLSQRFLRPWRGDAFPLYQALRAINPSPFACWLASDELTVVSSSPERLIRAQDGWVDTRPIAGTRSRAKSSDETLLGLELLLNEKERAEHIMLVDLARNDLGRLCLAGSVCVRELMALETYSHVIHIVSDVAGRLKKGVDAVDIIRAVFPGGTITGCPKVRCMQILRQLEPVARGLYTGSLGYLGFDGSLDLNIAIRTMVVRDNWLSFHVGAGIVADSDCGREYEETLAKAEALTAAIEQTTVASPEAYHARR